jgi:hypothetical protein
MIILPFIHKVINNNNTFKVNVIKFLTIGGYTLWEEKSLLSIDNDILNPNEIYRKNDIIKFDKNLYLCEIDTDKTKISDFYKWEELSLNDRDTFCWKTFYYFIGNDKVCWLESPLSEKLGKYSIKDLINKIVRKDIMSV